MYLDYDALIAETPDDLAAVERRHRTSPLAEARMLVERWRQHHNEARPHSALGYLPLAAYAAYLIPEPAPALA